MGNQQEMDIAWLAGIFDGEGTITMTKNNGTKNPDWNARKSEMSVTNCDERLIVKCIVILERIGIRPYVTEIHPRKRVNARSNTQKAYRVCVSKLKDTQTLSRLLAPHLTSKVDQAILMDRYASSRLERAWLLGQKQNDGKKHKLTRRPISSEEAIAADHLVEFNNRFSRSSTTAREGALAYLVERKIQSGLMRKHEKSAEMTDSIAV